MGLPVHHADELVEKGKIRKVVLHIVQNGILSSQIYGLIESKGLDVAWAGPGIAGNSKDWLLAAADNPRVDFIHHWARVGRERQMNFLPVHVHGGEVVIGPEIYPEGGGCLHCWGKRYFCGRPWLRRFVDLAVDCDDKTTDPWLTASAASLAARIVVHRLLSSLGSYNNELSKTCWPVYYLELRSFSGREWEVVQEPGCEHCAQLESDGPARASITLGNYRKPDSLSDRLRSLRELQFVRQAFTGHRCNIVENGKQSWPVRDGVVVSYGVPLIPEAHPEPCSGFGPRQDDAETAAILEGIERYCGAEPRGLLVSARGTFNQFRGLAVDPRTFGMHSEREYQANPGLSRYSDDLEMRFVWAHSFREQRQVMVPLQIGFYSRPRTDDNLFILGEGSSGCSVGSCLEEAILHGIFEVAERDAYMLTWLASLSPRRIDPSLCSDPEVRHLLRGVRSKGFELLAFNITTDLGIPAVGLIARREKKWPHLLCGAAAHLIPERALKKAFRELVGGISLWELSGELAQGRALELASDPTLVRKPMDHGLMYTARIATPHCEFMAGNVDMVSLEDMREPVQDLFSEDIGIELRRTLDRIISNGFDVLVVKHTGPEQKKHDLHVAKVLIPGALPGTWGDHLRRVVHLPRLDAALKTNQRSAPNPVPHPFP
jgi:ribosomal protein S12 methylthiotransferase accessory factor